MFGPGGVSPFQLLVVLALAFVFFGGKGKFSNAMSDLAKGLRGFRQGLKEGPDPDPVSAPPPSPQPLAITGPTITPSPTETRS